MILDTKGQSSRSRAVRECPSAYLYRYYILSIFARWFHYLPLTTKI